MNAKNLFEAVVFNDLKQFKTLLPAASQKDKHTALMEAAQRGGAQYIGLLLPVSSQHKRNALMEAVINGHLSCVTLLLPHSIRDSEALCGAVRHNHQDIFDFLLPIVPLHSHTFMALRVCLDVNSAHCHMFSMFERVLAEAYARHPNQLQSDFPQILSAAVYQGDAQALSVLLKHPLFTEIGNDDLALAIDKSHTTCVDLLLPHANHQACNAGLVAAVRFDDKKSVARLLPRADPHYDNSAALRFAALRNNQELFDLLYPLSNPQAALDILQHKWKNQPQLWSMLEERMRKDLHASLEHATENLHTRFAPKRKI